MFGAAAASPQVESIPRRLWDHFQPIWRSSQFLLSVSPMPSFGLRLPQRSSIVHAVLGDRVNVGTKSGVKSAEAIAYARARAERREVRGLRALKSDMIAAMDRLKAVEASTTWRATLPLRKVGKHLPRVMRRALRLEKLSLELCHIAAA